MLPVRSWTLLKRKNLARKLKRLDERTFHSVNIRSFAHAVLAWKPPNVVRQSRTFETRALGTDNIVVPLSFCRFVLRAPVSPWAARHNIDRQDNSHSCPKPSPLCSD